MMLIRSQLRVPLRLQASLLHFVFVCCAVGLARGNALGQAHPMPVAKVAQPMHLTDQQVEAFFAAIQDLRQLPSGWKSTDPSHPMAMVQAVQITEQTTAILNQHGFASPTEFQHVAYNASMAYAVLKEGGKDKMRRKLDKAKAEPEKAMAKLKGRMSPEQFQVLSTHVNDALMALATMENVPDDNIELMKKYRDRMAQLGGP